jgi:hypothetical protein
MGGVKTLVSVSHMKVTMPLKKKDNPTVTMMTARRGSPISLSRKILSVKFPGDSHKERAHNGQDEGHAGCVESQGHISADQGQLAHGQIENAGALVDENPAEGHQSVNASHHDPGNEGHKEQFHAQTSIPLSFDHILNAKVGLDTLFPPVFIGNGRVHVNGTHI